VEKKLNFECKIDAVEVLRQATMGLSHLHSMDIGELLLCTLLLLYSQEYIRLYILDFVALLFQGH
jgi:hypothetical protein